MRGGRLYHWAALAAVMLPPAAVAAQPPTPAASAQPDPREAVFRTRLAENNAAYRALSQGKADEAARVASRTERVRIHADRYGELSLEHAGAIQLLAFEHYREQRWNEVARLYSQALEIRRNLAGDTAADTLYAARTTAMALADAGRVDDAVAVLRSVLAAPGNDYSSRYADPLQRRALATSGVENKAMGLLRALHARLLLRQGRDLAAAAASAKLAATASTVSRERYGFGVTDEAILEIEERDSSIGGSGEERFGEWDRLYADILWASGRRDGAASDEVLAILQDATSAGTSRALARAAAARVGAVAGAGALIEERDRLAAQVADLLRPDMAGMSAAEQDALWDRVRPLNSRIEALDARITQALPEYFALLRPRPLSRAAAQSLLGADEAALIVVPSESGIQLLLVDRAGLQWHRSPLSEADLNQKVRRLLWDVGGNVEATNEEHDRWSAEGGGGYAFARGTAHDLYRELVAPFAARLQGRTHLAIIASGSLSSLPFSVLVTEAPQGQDGDPAALRSTAWLGDKFALTQLPSLQSLQLLRFAARRGGGAGTRFVGYGDPVLFGTAEDRGRRGARQRRDGGARPGAAPATPSAEGMPLADGASLRSLGRLPGTADELKAMSGQFPAGAATVRLAEMATEARLKAENLTGLSVLALATHGLLAGQAAEVGVRESGLVLTPPDQPSTMDDGLLTASEVAALRTDAEWVVLSACNTAAGDGSTGAEGLSGLARSFFFAGAQSLLVSHWPVRDDVAAVMTVKVLELQRQHPTWSRAQALQAATRAIREDRVADGDAASWAHPSAWGPFTLIGDSARRASPQGNAR